MDAAPKAAAEATEEGRCHPSPRWYRPPARPGAEGSSVGQPGRSLPWRRLPTYGAGKRGQPTVNRSAGSTAHSSTRMPQETCPMTRETVPAGSGEATVCRDTGCTWTGVGVTTVGATAGR